ncbi:hypothetical protein D3C84_610700 [compost metagenome]
MAEQLALHHRLGQGAGVDGDEGAVTARRQVVQCTGHNLLAGTGLAEDQHIGVGGGEGTNLITEAPHGRRLADQAAAELLAVG